MIWGFVVWVMHFEFKIEIDVFVQLDFLFLCVLIVTSEEISMIHRLMVKIKEFSSSDFLFYRKQWGN